jgi:hypothetical protein
VNELDIRMRRLLAGADTFPGFEARVLARVAALEAVPDAESRSLAERRRELEHRRLRRDSWMNAVTAAGIGAAGIAVVWRNGPDVARWVEMGVAQATDPALLMGFALAVLGLGLWPALRSLLPR